MDLLKSNSSNRTEMGVKEETSSVVVGFLLLLGVCMMLMNGVVVCCGIMYRAKLNTAYSLQILSLSLSDFVVGMTAIPLTLIHKYSGRETWFALCASNFIMYSSTQSATMYHILGICLHRLFVVAFKRTPGPSRSSYKRVVGYVVLTWIIFPIISLVPFLIWGQTGETLKDCSIESVFKENYNKAMQTLSGIVFVPLVLINLFYIIFITYLTQMKRRVFQVAPTDSSNKGLKTPTVPQNRNGDLDRNTVIPIASTSASANADVNSIPLSRISRAQGDHTGTAPTNTSTSGDEKENTLLTLSTYTVASTSDGRRSSKTQEEKATTPDPMHVEHSQRTRPIPAHWNAAKTIGIILLLVNLCTLPMLVVFLLESNYESITFSRDEKFLTVLALMMNSCMNPVVYTITMRPFRMCLVEMLNKFIRNVRRLIPNWCAT